MIYRTAPFSTILNYLCLPLISRSRHYLMLTISALFLSMPPGRETVCRQQSLLRQSCIHSAEPWTLINSPHLSHHLSYFICILS